MNAPQSSINHSQIHYLNSHSLRNCFSTHPPAAPFKLFISFPNDDESLGEIEFIRFRRQTVPDAFLGAINFHAQFPSDNT